MLIREWAMQYGERNKNLQQDNSYSLVRSRALASFFYSLLFIRRE